MKLRKVVGIVLTGSLICSAVSTTGANEFDDSFWEWYFGEYFIDDGYDTNDYYVPVITSPREYDSIIASDEIRIKWKYTGNESCVVCVEDETGNVSEIQGESGNKAIILSNKLAKGASYTITVKAGSNVSEPVKIRILDNKQEIVEIVSRTDVEKAEERINTELVIPEGAFDSKESADKRMKTISVNVWQLNSKNQKVTASIPITVNAQLADTVTKIFNEIYLNQLQFPIKSASCYSYRTTVSGGRLSEHAYGTAIDINPNENYCVYSSGNVVGTCYEPYTNQYSVVPEIINIFRKYNFYWGGSFGDYMHFSYFGT